MQPHYTKQVILHLGKIFLPVYINLEKYTQVYTTNFRINVTSKKNPRMDSLIDIHVRVYYIRNIFLYNHYISVNHIPLIRHCRLHNLLHILMQNALIRYILC